MDTPNATDAASALRRLVLPVYLPLVFVNGGVAMLVPILPLYLTDLGLRFTPLTVVMAAAGVGSMLSQVPIGRALERYSETAVMTVALTLTAAAVGLMGVTGFIGALVALRFIAGIGSVGWLLSRQTFMTRTIDPLVRGRAMAMFGGTTRVAFLIGPILGGWTAQAFGFSAAFALTAAITATGMVPLLFWRPTSFEQRDTEAAPSGVRVSAFRDHTRSLAVAGAGQVCILAARQGRFVVLPLIGAAIGLEPGPIGALVSIGAFADLVLFPASGYLMDRFGRLAAIVPSFVLLGIGLFVLAAAESYAGVVIAAIIIGVGNGLGSGTMLALSADLAPVASPSQFLAALGAIRDGGKIVGPLAVGALADSAGLSAASVMLGAVAFVGLAILVLGVGETRDLQRTAAAAG